MKNNNEQISFEKKRDVYHMRSEFSNATLCQSFFCLILSSLERTDFMMYLSARNDQILSKNNLNSNVKQHDSINAYFTIETEKNQKPFLVRNLVP